MTYAVALTGGIASGKSAVAAQFARLGVSLIDADLLSHELVMPGRPAIAEIEMTFGNSVILSSGALDRTKMRAIIFTNEYARQTLESIIHPRVRARIAEEVQQCNAPYCVVIVPLLAENKEDYLWVDRILVVDTSRATQLERLTRRSNVDIMMARHMIEAQASREERLALANDIIDNTAAISRLALIVNRLHERYLAMSGMQS